MKEGWEYKKLGEICFIERGGSPRPIQQYITNRADGLNWIKIGDAVEGSKYINSTKEKIIPEGLKKTRFVHKGDFILSNSMSFGKPYILGIDGCIHDGWLVIRDNNKIFDKSFLYYLLSSPNMYQEFKRLAVGGVVNNLNSNLVRNVVVPIPPLVEQERIVAELDLLSSIIDKKKVQLNELDQLAQSIFYDMFGDPITNEKGWEVKKMGEIGTFQRGGGFLKSDFVENGVPCIHYGQIHMKFGPFLYQHLTEIPKEVAAKSKIASKGDVIIAITSEDVEGSCKCTAWLGDYDVYVGAHAAIFKHSLNPIYVSYYIGASEFQREKQKYVHGIKVMEIKPSDIEKINILLPPLPLQQEFASKIEAIERQKSLIQQSIDETQTLFDSRMDYWFG